MKIRVSTKGFTLVEILVVIGIIAIILTMSVGGFRSMYHASGERAAVSEITDAFRNARSKTLGAQNNAVYGVLVSTSTVTRFIGNTYTAGHASNTLYTFEADAFATGTLVTTATPVYFERLTGRPSVTGTIYVIDADRTSTTSIVISATGLVE